MCQILQEECISILQQDLQGITHTRPELQLSTSDQRESGLGGGIHRPLMHQPVNYPDVRIV